MGVPNQPTNMGVDMFKIIDVDNNGKLSQKEVMSFIAVCFMGAEDADEKKCTATLLDWFVEVGERAHAKAQEADPSIQAEDVQITLADMDEQPSEAMCARLEACGEKIAKLETDLQANEEMVRGMIAKANEMSESELGEAIAEAAGM